MRISIVLLKYPAGSLLLIIAILSVSARTGRCDDDRAVPKCEAASMMCPTDQDDWRLADNGNVAYYVLPEANRFCIYFKCGPNNFNGLIRQSIDGERLVIVNFTTTYSNKAIESLVVDASRSFSLRHSPGDVYCPPVFALRSHNDTASELNVCNVIQYAQRVLSASENITVEANEAFTVNASCSYSRGGPAVGPSALDVRFPSRTLYQSWLQRGNSCMLSSDERANICPVRMDLTKAGFGGAYARLQFRCNDCEDVPKHIDPLQ
ncbi:uncharacterized protein LOC135828577 [Sycon ciliatum]|uniref:uncharacterized protein LOC135828577 n=1 Tax=Sycon ciliatum TaxID=27933 RepID=UPI0031F65E9E